jgi:hypothetical protein
VAGNVKTAGVAVRVGDERVEIRGLARLAHLPAG